MEQLRDKSGRAVQLVTKCLPPDDRRLNLHTSCKCAYHGSNKGQVPPFAGFAADTKVAGCRRKDMKVADDLEKRYKVVLPTFSSLSPYFLSPLTTTTTTLAPSPDKFLPLGFPLQSLLSYVAYLTSWFAQTDKQIGPKRWSGRKLFTA